MTDRTPADDPETPIPGGEERSTPTPEEDEVPAPTWARLLLAAVPFVAALLVYLVLRSVTG